ncbi:2-hydroxyacid dehydrogenase [Mycobacteroides abscessus]|uniref:2-hydroxyacid dehydrogenase n=1 Tax=Mycobacteroides abscessus TaxID=36809 RepID=UPI0009A78F38|nr:2-hydroxyacid dehydrogenase [Mycobacteroides abscessus]RIT50065.1 hydroxyacid dehydrogenase [Mycobacteroides abscessus]SKT55543.1 D-3-phosphoglycerate dehydrogenase [Mycobacteroides abscessus subsp. massiliense]SKT72685.1 D-3-phosphoglycerate dehydrogenase [Mycobacteroides abscessus subsp. massiliense]SLG03688.1 2-hydroxyacid dehydrogenase family [Mycobacteroides abscessus subsp. massiliense]
MSLSGEDHRVRVLAHFPSGPRVLEQLAPHADWLDVRFCAEDDDNTFYAELPGADVLWHVLRPLSADDIARGERLRLIHKFGAGVNTIALDAAVEHGVAVANMPGANAPSVAEGALLLMLAALRQLPRLDRDIRAGNGWPTDQSLGETVRDIGSCTIGLVGYGNIAKSLEKILLAMGATVLHTSTRDDGTGGWRGLDDLLTSSDIVSLHLPLTEASTGMLDSAALSRMKPGSVLVNTSRGAVVDETALVNALQQGPLGAAGLDVFAQEPVSPENPLLALPNVVLTPHVTWFTADTMTRYLDRAIDNCRRIHEGMPLADRVR